MDFKTSPAIYSFDRFVLSIFDKPKPYLAIGFLYNDVAKFLTLSLSRYGSSLFDKAGPIFLRVLYVK